MWILADSRYSQGVDEQVGYGTLLGRLRENARTYLRKTIELARQETSELVRANLRAAVWFVAALTCLWLVLVTLVVLVVALVALLLPLWAAALATLVLFALAGGAFAYVGYRKLVLHGPDRTIAQVKETARWVKSHLNGPSGSS